MLEWIRPQFIWYIDTEGNKRRYYPDFYLPKYDLYLDPKNDYLIKTDINKIYDVSRQNSINIAIIGINKLDNISIKNMVGDRGNAPLSHGCKPRVLLLN
jgi:hypothetical protein